MQQLVAVWSHLDTRRRLIVGGATLFMFAAILGLSRMASNTDMTLLYSGLESGAAGEVVRSLEQQGVPYEVRGGAIFVDSSQRDQLRMTLASEGLPANGGAGYELLDSLSGFGTTSQMFDAAYWRAKEGELARTIVASPQIRSARVHIANPSSQAFRRSQKPSAAVTVIPAGGTLSPAHAKALRFLVSSSVAGLLVEDVSVIDGSSGQIISSDEAAAQPHLGEDRAERLRQNVLRLLEARVGPGKAVVEVSVETHTDRESIVERRFDPEGRVAISTETEERTISATDQRGGGDVTVASNLPDGDAAQDKNSSSNNSQTVERVNYEVSETQREIVKTPGAVKRLSVAVLLDGVRVIDDSGKEVWEPLPEAEIEGLRELVSSAVGFDSQRGDVITLKSMPFDPIEPAGTLAEPGLIDKLGLNVMSLVQLAVLAIVGLVLGLFVLRPILTAAPQPALPALPEPDPEDRPPARAALEGEISTDEQVPIGAMNILPPDDTPTTLPALAGQPDPTALDPVERLRKLIEERQTETVEILRSWMEDEEERA